MHNHEETQRKNRRNTGRVILLHVGVLAAFFVMAAWIWHCPIRLLFGVPCPGCGTTRACLSVLKLKIPEAFAYQPVFFLNVLLFLYGIHRNVIRRNAMKKGLRWSDKAETAVLVLVIAVVLTVYVIRLIRAGFSGDGTLTGEGPGISRGGAYTGNAFYLIKPKTVSRMTIMKKGTRNTVRILSNIVTWPNLPSLVTSFS